MSDTGESQPEGNAQLPARTETFDFAPAERIGDAADGMAEFNRLLWQFARSLFIFVAMLLAISLLVIAYYAAEFMVGL